MKQIIVTVSASISTEPLTFLGGVDAALFVFRVVVDMDLKNDIRVGGQRRQRCGVSLFNNLTASTCNTTTSWRFWTYGKKKANKYVSSEQSGIILLFFKSLRIASEDSHRWGLVVGLARWGARMCFYSVVNPGTHL